MQNKECDEAFINYRAPVLKQTRYNLPNAVYAKQKNQSTTQQLALISHYMLIYTQAL